MAFRATALARVGLFDERLGPGAAGHEEETEMSARLHMPDSGSVTRRARWSITTSIRRAPTARASCVSRASADDAG